MLGDIPGVQILKLCLKQNRVGGTKLEFERAEGFQAGKTIVGPGPMVILILEIERVAEIA